MKSEYEMIKEWRKKQEIIDQNRHLIEKWVKWVGDDLSHAGLSEYQKKTQGELLFLLKTML